MSSLLVIPLEASTTFTLLQVFQTLATQLRQMTTIGKILHTIEQEGNEIYTIDYSYDATKFATGGMNKEVGIKSNKKSIHMNKLGACV